MHEYHFLVGCSDQLRIDARNVFDVAVVEARKFCDSSNPFIEIIEVKKGSGNNWCADGHITIEGDIDNLGVIYHEVFHSVFHGSKPWEFDCRTTKKWGDAFCDVFRYLMGLEFPIERQKVDFQREFEKYIKLNDYEISKSDTYTKLGSRIFLRLTNRNIIGFRSMWQKLCKKKDLNLFVEFSVSN